MNRKIVALTLAVALVFAWYMGLKNMNASSGNYEAVMRTAKKYEDESLYQKAILEYKSALTYKDTLPVRLKVVDLYRKAIEIGEITSDGNLVATLLETMSKYREKNEPYEVACEYFYSVLNYEELINALNTAEKFKINSPKVSSIRNVVRYLYEELYSNYSDITDLNNGRYIIKNADNQYSIDLRMSASLKNCEFVSPYSADGATVAKKLGKVFIVNKDGVRQKYFDDAITASSGMSDGNIACAIGGKWAYYNYDGKKISKDYFYAGRFLYGAAAVQEKEGEWKLINAKFEPLTKEVYKDVKLNSSEECAAGGIILVKTADKYEILRVEGYSPGDVSKVRLKKTEGFSCLDCDPPRDPVSGSNKGSVWFAFKADDQKWGFADLKGKVVAKPKFAAAKSFSNGYAAVSDGYDWSFADENGEVVIKPELSGAGYFAPNGCCAVRFKGDAWSFIRMYLWQNKA